ncbi:MULTISPECIES: hypothetical protein [Myroides]|uniref:Lipocalin-like domain-containing protein n=1 Tax=Myroides albus TaxID=2562892 RepID=A0A6I3LPI9_9FLAO|nr:MULTISPECIES: hypothetical protein [Myroides]MTG98581.1 hypothetical protein [Myroides albus]MVX36035.1 hypothetical protein [Myroides sp. LoEW2-1]UVD79948.1 hypothetical protein NWE55_01260 [Myroides albus]
MKKIMALVLFVSTSIAFTACSSDDNTPVRSEMESPEGTWESSTLTYAAFDENGKPFHASPEGVEYTYDKIPFGEDPTKEETFIIEGNKATLKDIAKSNKETIVEGELINKTTIVLDNEKYHDRTIVNVTKTTMTLSYRMDLSMDKMKNAYGILTVKYLKK